MEQLRAKSHKRSSGPEDSLTWSLQALLIRHEAYIADAEAERSRQNSHIATLEFTNRDLEASNRSLQEENKRLEEQVDDVNKAVAEAETNIKSLTSTLEETRTELDRVLRLTKRTEDLEIQLLECERQQAQLQVTLNRTIDEERAANQQWRASLRQVAQLEAALESIEKEAASERALHAETVARWQRRKTVEQELGRSATPGPVVGRDRQGGEVVSSFVREILQDNANMQMAMTELRDMLAFYKEAQQSPLDLEPQQPKRHVSLEEELGMTQEQKQELHVHHHYHAPQQREPSRPPIAPRVRKRRPMLPASWSSGRSTPVTSRKDSSRPPFRHKATSSTSSSILSGDGRSSSSKRWSSHSAHIQSSFDPSSDPSSPQSTSYCASTIFERSFVDDSTEYSQPTTPEWSPIMCPQAGKGKQPMEDEAFQSLSLPGPSSLDEAMDTSTATLIPPLSQPAIEEEPSASPSPKSRAQRSGSPLRRQLRRTDSHASLMSISGMDIHTSFADNTPAPPPAFALGASRQHSGPILTAATASAMSGISGTDKLTHSLRGRLAPVAEGNVDRYDPFTDTFGNFKRVGGWLASRWAGGSSADLRGRASAQAPTSTKVAQPPPPSTRAPQSDGESAASPAASIPSDTHDPEKTPTAKTSRPQRRPPGINQLGGLPPLPQPRPKVALIRGTIDEDALKECLNES